MTGFEKCWGIYTGKSLWLRLTTSQNFTRKNTPTFLKPNHNSHLPAYEDGTESVPKRRHINFKRRGIARLRLFSSQTISRINTPTFLKPSHSSHLPAYEDGTECSETSAYKLQTPGNCPAQAIFEPNLFPYKYPNISQTQSFFTPTCL
jgi:hypothetical protein